MNRLLPLVCLLLAACSATPLPRDPPITANPPGLLHQWLQGPYRSGVQASTDSDYADVSLQAVSILPQISSGYWLYVEQALATAPGQPLEQRAFFLHDTGDGGVVMDVYALKDSPRFVRGWESGTLDQLEPEQLLKREGCSLYLRLQGDAFLGSTRGKQCASRRAGASYTTIAISVSQSRLGLWDRDFDARGRQVAGTTRGPYAFERITR